MVSIRAQMIALARTVAIAASENLEKRVTSRDKSWLYQNVNILLPQLYVRNSEKNKDKICLSSKSEILVISLFSFCLRRKNTFLVWKTNEFKEIGFRNGRIWRGIRNRLNRILPRLWPCCTLSEKSNQLLLPWLRKDKYGFRWISLWNSLSSFGQKIMGLSDHQSQSFHLGSFIELLTQVGSVRLLQFLIKY